MNAQQLNYLNIGLMAIATLAAFYLPFELFLFSYAVLGPLHYLTEISWLHKQNFFMLKRSDFWWLVGLTVVLTIMYISLNMYFSDEVFNAAVNGGSLNLFQGIIDHLADNTKQYSTILMMVGLFSALGFLFLKSLPAKIFYMLLVFTVALFLSEGDDIFVIFGLFLPTVIHIFIFTGAFIVYGAMKGRDWTAMLSLGVFAACAASFFLVQPDMAQLQLSDYTVQNLNRSGFANLNLNLLKFLGMEDNLDPKFLAPGVHELNSVFFSEQGVKVMRFVAFGYTYHYLNWFSKTSVIKWHKVDKRWLIATIVIWIGAMALYAYDFIVGLYSLYFLSMLHVFLEFPLNFRTFGAIGTESMKWMGLAKT